MAPSDAESPPFLHPASGLLILGLDWLLFSGSAITLGLSTIALAAIGFGVGSLGTGLLQRRLHGDHVGMALVKGMLAGAAVGIPFPIAGTALGGGVLALSGLNKLGARPEPDPPLPSSSENE